MYTCIHNAHIRMVCLNVELGCLCTKCAIPGEARRGHAWDWSCRELRAATWVPRIQPSAAEADALTQ